MRIGRATAAASLLLALPLPAGAQESANSCVSCHAKDDDPELSAPVAAWRRSVHAAADVTCDACHGGDPFAQEEAASMDEDEAGFLGAPDWDEVPEFCGVCHETVLRAYRESAMGGKLEEGKEVAVCTTCHMTDGHAITAPEPREILTQSRCGECHDSDRAIALRDQLESMDRHLSTATAELDPLRGHIDTSELDGELDEIRERAVFMAHTYDVARIGEAAEIAAVRLVGVFGKTRELAREARFRRKVGVGVVTFLSLACIGTLRLAADLKRRARG